MLTSEELQEIRGRAEKAAEGPWTTMEDPALSIDIVDKSVPPDRIAYDLFIPNADFIAHARADIPALLDTIDELRKMGRWLMTRWTHPVGWELHPSDEEDYLEICAALELET